MAVNKFTGASSSLWNVATNWSLGSVPTISDGNIATFDSTSPNCTLGGNYSCNHLDMTGYSATFTTGSSIFTVAGDITLAGSISISTGRWQQTAAGTLTSNGNNFPGTLSIISSSATRTMADNWTVNGLILGTTASPTINDNIINVNGDMQIQNNVNILGTTVINMTGSGTISHTGSTGAFGLDLNIIGDYTIGNFRYGKSTSAPTLTYISGTVVCTGTFVVAANSNIDVNGSASCAATSTSNTGINFFNFTLSAGIVATLISQICIINNFTWGGGVANIRTSDIFLLGNFIVSSNSTNNNSTSTIYFIGTGTWSGNFNLLIDFTINTNGVLTIQDVQFGSTGTIVRTLNYMAGKIIHNGTLTISANSSVALLNFDKVRIKEFMFVGGTGTVTMNKFFKGDSNTITKIYSSNTSTKAFIITEPSYSDFITCERVAVSNTSKYKPVVGGGNGANKGFNSNIIWNNQLPNGFAQSQSTEQSYGFQ